MALTIGMLAIMVIAEVALTAYCLATRASQVRARSWARIGMLGVFILAALVSVIQWGMRWYLLAALLLAWAALGAWALWGRRAGPKAFTPWRSVLGAVGRLLLILVALTPAILIPQFRLPPPTGPHQVATRSYTYTDPSRAETFTATGEPRKVNVSCWYPQDEGGTYPLVVFSHGAFGMKGGNLSTFMDLASNGYVACSIDHPYHSLYTVDTAGRRTTVDPAFFQEVIDLHNDKFDEATQWALVKKWMALRVADMGFVLNTLTEQTRSPGDDPVYRRIDPEHIGLFGHSLGGATSAYLARARGDIDAVINLDGSMFGEFQDKPDGTIGINEATFPAPLLVVYSDALGRQIDPSYDPDGRNPVNYIVATAPNAFKAHVPGNHFNVTDVPLISPVFAALIMAAAPGNGGAAVDAYAAMERTNGLVVEFFDAYLKGAGSFSVAGV